MGHKRPFSAARDYLHVEALEGLDREASEFLVDVAHMVSQGRGEEKLSLEDLHQKWGTLATWHPGDRLGGEGKSGALNVYVAEERRKKKEAEKTSKCCDAGCTTRTQMRERHGVPDKFAVSCLAAVPAFVSVDEANSAIARYRRIYDEAPE